MEEEEEKFKRFLSGDDTLRFAHNLREKKMYYARYGKCEHDFGTSKLLLIVFVRRKKGEGVSVCDLSVQKMGKERGGGKKRRENYR